MLFDARVFSASFDLLKSLAVASAVAAIASLLQKNTVTYGKILSDTLKPGQNFISSFGFLKVVDYSLDKKPVLSTLKDPKGE